MILLDLIRKRQFTNPAIANLATPATDVDTINDLSIAKIAVIANPATNEISETTEIKSSAVIAKLHGFWSEEEVLLCKHRIQIFIWRGIPDLNAEELACRLVERDRTRDDRKSCAECQSFRNNRCVKYRELIGGSNANTLHRCDCFVISRNWAMSSDQGNIEIQPEPL